MRFISFNHRGIGGVPKKLALKRLFSSLSPNILLLQETMCKGEVISKLVSPLVKELGFLYVNVDGDSGGILLGWSPYFKSLLSSS
jgi:exonuclease III